MAGAGPALGRAAPDPRGQGLAGAQGAAPRHVALRAHAAAPGGHAGLRDGVAAPQRRPGSGGEALLLDDGAGRVAPHGGVAEADRGGRRHRRARPVPGRACAHDARGRHARGEGLPDAGLLRAPDHLALPPDCPRVARHRARGPLLQAHDRRRHPPRCRDGLRAGAATQRRREDEAEARRGGEPAPADLRPARTLAPEGAGVHRRGDAVARPREAARGSRDRREAGRISRSGRQRRRAARLTMAATALDGAALAAKIRAGVRDEVAELGEIGLATVLVGEDPASQIYIRLKHQAADEAGIRAVDKRFPEETTEEELLEVVEELSADDSIDGILVQTPLPPQIEEARVMRALDPTKDVDGLHPFNAGQLFFGEPTMVPATPLGIMLLLQEHKIPVAGASAVVVGRSLIVGRPVAMLLLHENATLTICHSRTDDLARQTLDADILVVAVGQAGVVSADMVKAGAAVLDVGMNRTEAGLVGDVDPGAAKHAAFMTPVPGGVGPMTIAMLLGNAVRAARYRRGVLAFPPYRR